jgi:transposase InsO family protein
MLNVLDEFTHECLAIRVARKLKAIDVIDVLSDLFILRGVPAHIRSDNGPEFVAKAAQEWIQPRAMRRRWIRRRCPPADTPSSPQPIAAARSDYSPRAATAAPRR